ncbi:MAG: hypothetical protein KJ061_16430 [Vicinamibacteraceae bacterium]|nr:hypothetical protein [Vicinamibacteraceae bacterium]
MSERKYRQRGYQDDDRDRTPRAKSPDARPQEREPRGRRAFVEPPRPNLPGFAEAVRCAACGHQFTGSLYAADAVCLRCGAALHSCAQCSFFDPGARFECMQPVTVRIMPKDAANQCRLFEPRVKVERETTSRRPDSPHKAFDDLFKF